MAYVQMTPEQYEEVAKAAEEQAKQRVAAKSVRYAADTDCIVLEMEKATHLIRRSEVREFADFSKEQMGDIRLTVLGDAIAVGEHDVQVDMVGLLADLMPAAAAQKAVARIAGLKTSHKKAVAARKNGLRGGRPRKTPEPSVKTGNP